MTTPAATWSLASLFLVAGIGIAAGPMVGCNGRGQGQDGTTPAADSATAEPTPTADRFEIDLFAFGRQLGTIAPCGCTTEPLGGLQFAFGYIEAHSEPGQRLILEPGSFLYPDPDGPEGPTDEAGWAQAEQRAALLHGQFGKLDGLVSGLGPTDFASSSSGFHAPPELTGFQGAAALTKLALPRVIANLDPASEAAKQLRSQAIEPQRVIPLGHGLTAAVTQVVDLELAAAARATKWGKDFPPLIDPVTALKELGPKLGEANLQVVMVHGPRALAETIAREVEGIDVVIMGGVIDNPERSRVGSAPVQIGATWLLEPGDRAQTVGHLTLSIDASLEPGTLPENWTLVPAKSQREAELARVEEKLAKFADDPSADAGFVERLAADRDRLRAELENPAIPADVAVAVIPEQIKVSCRLESDAGAKAALTDYDAWVAERNREQFTGVKPPAPKPGTAGYVGVDACTDCHEEAVELWKTTVHARGYETLVQANKQFDLSCVSCHVTGFRKPGGSEVVENAHLQAVQCEQCHGPGSLHVEDPSTTNIVLEAPSNVCLSCHTPDHSDTFEYEAYLRDVLGPGHGPEARAKLGDGPTGRELRAAGLAKAGGGCPKM